jgi:MFS family permease
MAFLAVHFTNDLALSTFLVGVGITAVAIGGVAGPFGLGWLSDRSSRTGVLQGSLLASALSTFWLAFQGAFLPLLLLNLVLYGVATRSRVSLTQVLVVDSLADADRDAAFSVFFFLGFASGPFWSLTVGLLMETVGFEVAFSVLGVSYLIGMLLMLFVVDPRRAQR